jgi:hypothetical protein
VYKKAVIKESLREGLKRELGNAGESKPYRRVQNE